MTTLTYWAAEPPERITGIINERFDRYRRRLNQCGLLQLWRAAHRAYHGMDPEGSYASAKWIQYAGEQGELAVVHVPHFRSLLQQSMAIAIGERPALEVTARTDDPDALAQTVVGRQVLEHDLDDTMEERLRSVHERAMVYGAAFLVDEWDAEKGEEIGLRQQPVYDDDGEPLTEEQEVPQPPAIDPLTGAQTQTPPTVEEVPVTEDVPARAGDPIARILSPIDVAHDIDLTDPECSVWWITRVLVNKWDYAAQYPEHRMKILGAPTPNQRKHELWNRTTTDSDTETDFVELLTLYHAPTPAMPQGRKVATIGDARLYDVPFPYESACVHQHSVAHEIGKSHGYAEAWGLLALNRALDAVESGILTTHDAGSVPNWVARRDAGTDVRQLRGGLNLVEYEGEEEPKPMQMPEVRESSMALSQHYLQHMQVIFGVNDVVRGNPGDNLKAGVSLALVASMSVQSQNGQQRAYGSLTRRWGTARLQLYRMFADEPRLIRVTGKDSAVHVKRFVGSDLSEVLSVKVNNGAPLTRTLAGKVELASTMLEAYGPEVVPPHVYMAIVETGRVEILTRTSLDDVALAQAENERLLRGLPCKVLIEDDHACHIREHRKPLDDLEFRNDPSPEAQVRLQGLLAHLGEHHMYEGEGMQPPPNQQGGGGEPADAGANVAPGAANLPPIVEDNMPDLPPGSPPISGAQAGGMGGMQ